MIAREQTLYVATRGDAIGIERMRAFVAKAIALGYVHAYDWSKDIEQARANGWTNDREVPSDLRLLHAESDWEAATTCDVFVYLTPHEKSEGAAGELVAAITAKRLGGARNDVIVVGKPNLIFAALADQRFDTDEDAIGYLAKRMRMLAVLR